jgi:outer membrane protein OmpA-like peptidoglycan-associated protein
MRRFLILCFIILTGFTVLVYSQQESESRSRKAVQLYNNGIRNYSLKNYQAAEQNFLDAIKEDKMYVEAYFILAEVYEDCDRPAEAIMKYKQAFSISETAYPYGWIRKANLEYREGMYEEAKTGYEKYLEIASGNRQYADKAQDGIDKCNFAINAMDNPVDFHPVNLGPAVNTTNDEYWPSLSADEITLVITRLVNSSYVNRQQEDFYISHFTDGKWSVMEDAGSPLNTPDNEGAQTITGDGRLMIFTACNRSDAIGRCDLYFSEKEGDNWSVPQNLGRPVNSAYRETQPSLSSDGRTLYFSSDRPGGLGQHDIWVSNNEDGKWSVPENLGDSVNTAGVEMSPFIHPDNRTLYFSSDGHKGLGGYDIFISRLDSNRWSRAVNMGYPINTNRDEIGLIVNASGNKAYYSSDINRDDGKDIFVFDIPVQNRPDAVTYMKGRIADAKTMRALKANFELTDLNSGKVTNISTSDSITGEFIVCIPTGHNYMLNVSKPGYLFYSENFSMKGIYAADKPFFKDIPLEPLQAGVRIILKNIFYDTDSFTLKRESEAELHKIIQFLNDNPGISIEIGGHTDNTGNEKYNQSLSENRARIVAEYLIANAISRERVVYRGYGMSLPVAPNDTEENKAKNRRTELKIIR